MALPKVVVLKLSGRLFFSEDFDEVVSLLRRISKKIRLVLVAGGGKTARDYIKVGRELGADQASLDELGIAASRINALVLTKALKDSSIQSVPTTLNELVGDFEVAYPEKKILVVGGLQPGQSTNGVAAIIAEKLRAKFVNATDVEGVFTKDPRKFKDARLLKVVSSKRLHTILGKESVQAGGYDLMDPIALKLIERSRIDTRIVKCDVPTLRAFFLQSKNIGTKIVFSN